MKWTLLLIALACLVVVFRLTASSTLPTAVAREHLRKGAVLVDVRTVAEYNAGHLTNAVNIPLDQVTEILPQRVPDKSKVVLLHCRSGRRSGMAEKQLRALGYTNVFNVGSYGQAENLVNGDR
ncbi:MAG TPA: rhodanese-like domain-containing protein [Verrucomicrobiae bacterium]